MDVLGEKECRRKNGSVFVTQITTWTLLGLCVDHFFKTWARYGTAAVEGCDVYTRQKIDVSNVIRMGSQKYPSPGQQKRFDLTDEVRSMALKSLEKVIAKLHGLNWLVFDGDVDIKTNSGRTVGAIDGIADNMTDLRSLALIEIKVRKIISDDMTADACKLCTELDTDWSTHAVPRLRAPWTTGVLVILFQKSCVRSFPSCDTCQIFSWERGAPPCASSAVGPARQPSVAAASRPAPVSAQVRTVSPAAKFEYLLTALKDKSSIVDDSWVDLAKFLDELSIKKNRDQTSRYVEGGGAWTLKSGCRKRRMALHKDYE